jgi:hypothetical protein
MADVLLRARPSRSQTDPAPFSHTLILSSYPAPPLETTIHPVAVAIPIATLVSRW